MQLTRREFLPLIIMTPMAAQLIVRGESKSPIMILESTARGRKDFDEALRRCDEWVTRYAKMYFTGFKHSMDTNVMIGHFLWYTIATYRTGRKETVNYYVGVGIHSAEIWDPPALAPQIDLCLARAKEFRDQFAQTGTICTVKNPRRKVAAVEHYEDERYSGIPVPYFNPSVQRVFDENKQIS